AQGPEQGGSVRCDAWLPVDRDLRGAATQINSTGRCLPGAAPGCWRADNITWGFTPDGGRIMQNASVRVPRIPGEDF
ncbi:MAG: hypothetical protein ACK54L_23655, partial [Betaproteobacteria bacterium]